jgi:hypothetical protein
MVRSKTLLFVIAFIIVTSASCQIKQDKKRLNLSDSTSVKNFIKSTTICDRLKYVEQDTDSFVSAKGFTGLILESITKETGKPLFLTISNGGIIESKDKRSKMLQEQVVEIKQILKCKE